jgi:hypothetical protein
MSASQPVRKLPLCRVSGAQCCCLLPCRIILVEDFLEPELCQDLINLATPRCVRSRVSTGMTHAGLTARVLCPLRLPMPAWMPHVHAPLCPVQRVMCDWWGPAARRYRDAQPYLSWHLLHRSVCAVVSGSA